MEYLWSPHPKEDYTVTVNGEPAGLGARLEFNGRPGLWNMFWLHSVKVDALLNWPIDPELAPMHTKALTFCIESSDYSCHGVSFEFLCANLTAEAMVDRLVAKDEHPPIRRFWDETSSGWLSFVHDRLKSFKSIKKKRGEIIKGNFSLR